MTAPIETVRLRITGQVQGVGYRLWMTRTAASLGLRGWVRNRTDGSVEALFVGRGKVVAEMVALCRHGPPSAHVEAVLNEPTGPEDLELRRPGEKFSVLPTA